MSLRTEHDLGYRGSQPRAKTLRRLRVQQMSNLPLIGKRIRLGGVLYHPTKGLRYE
jgi:hypothetical protein